MPTWVSRRAYPKRVRFLAGESTGSYVTRLAARNSVSVEHLLERVGQGQSRVVDPRYTELYVDAAGRERLAALAGRPVEDLCRALVGLRAEQLLPGDGDSPVWRWPWEPRDGYLVRACGLCAGARGIREPVWLMRPDTWHICVRHGRLTDNSRDDSRPFDSLDVWPRTVAAERRRLRLQQRLGPVARALVADGFAFAARYGGGRFTPDRRSVIYLLPEAVQVAVVLGRVEHPRLTGQLTGTEYDRWLKDAAAELPGFVSRGLEAWMEEHHLLPGRRGSSRTRPVGVRPSAAVPHAQIPELASVHQLTCLPWDMVAPAERPFG